MSTNSLGDVYSGVVVSSNGATSWLSSTQVSTHIESTPVTLTSSTRSFSEVIYYTCPGVEVSGSSSCTDDFVEASTALTTIPPFEKTQLCASWLPAPTPIKTTVFAADRHINCATAVEGPAYDAVPKPWDPKGKDFNWFRPKEDQVRDFCEYLANERIVIHAGDPDGKNSPGECAVYTEPDIALGNYGLAVQVAFDYNGCEADDKEDWNTFREEGINMGVYGSKRCRERFTKNIIGNCECPAPLLTSRTYIRVLTAS